MRLLHEAVVLHEAVALCMGISSLSAGAVDVL